MLTAPPQSRRSRRRAPPTSPPSLAAAPPSSPTAGIPCRCPARARPCEATGTRSTPPTPSHPPSA
eukprot:1673980-Pyramimonas_sp.AAC.1